MPSLIKRFHQLGFFVNKQGFWFVIIISLVACLINLYMKLDVTPTWFNGHLDRNHARLLEFSYTNNEQSRLFQFLIPELFRKIFGLSVINAYILQRFLFTFGVFLLFYLFVKKWFDKSLSILCVVILAIMMAYTYRNHLQESAPLLSLTFLVALWTIREKKTYLYTLILLFGSINNETMLYLPAVYFFVNFETWKLDKFLILGGKTILTALPAYIAVVMIRFIINIDAPHLGEIWNLTRNLKNIDDLFLSFNLFWIMAFLKFRQKPLFLQRSLLTVPLFIIPHMLTGIISETRQMIPLGFIIIPASIIYLQGFFKTNRIIVKTD